MNEMGGSRLWQRQFVETEGYSIAVLTDRHDFPGGSFPWMMARHPRWLSRLLRTRFGLWGHDYIHLLAGHRVPEDVLRFARDFNPDIIITGAETWVCDMGIALARRLRVPVAGYFMDWPTYASLAHPWVKRRMTRIFRSRYRKCDLAFGICPEMLEALGDHPNARVFYPSRSIPEGFGEPFTPSTRDPFTILFSGNLGQWYGKAVDALHTALSAHPSIRLRICGRNGPWSGTEEAELRRAGIYLGFVDDEAYGRVLKDADALLVIMGFDEESRLIESTSFKSKMVDYLASRKPLVIWGPDYCTAVRHARSECFAEVVTSSDPEGVVKVIEELRMDPARQAGLVEEGTRFFRARLDSGKVFTEARNAILQTIDAYTSTN